MAIMRRRIMAAYERAFAGRAGTGGALYLLGFLRPAGAALPDRFAAPGAGDRGVERTTGQTRLTRNWQRTLIRLEKAGLLSDESRRTCWTPIPSCASTSVRGSAKLSGQKPGRRDIFGFTSI